MDIIFGFLFMLAGIIYVFLYKEDVKTVVKYLFRRE